jgi:hypothetical protein
MTTQAPRQEKAPLTQQALTARALALGGAVIAALAATAVTGSALRFLLSRAINKR